MQVQTKTYFYIEKKSISILLNNLVIYIIYKRIQNFPLMSDITKQVNQFNKEVETIKFKAVKNKIIKADVQIERLLNQKFYNPYDVLQLDANATQEEIKKQFRNISIVLHPDRCKDPRSKDAWHVVEQAYKTLVDPEKKKVYIRIMREAMDRAQFQRDKQNKKRTKNGQLPLPDSTFQDQYQQICLNIFKDLQQKKDHVIKLQQSTFNRKMEEMETKKMVEQFRILTQEEWQRSRDKRVQNWRNFSQKKFVVGSKKSDGAIRPTPVKSQVRPHYTIIQEKKKNI